MRDYEYTSVEVAKSGKRCWAASEGGKINLLVRYGRKPLEFSKGTNAIELNSEADISDVLRKEGKADELD